MNSKLDKFLEEDKEKEINICIHDTPDPDAVGAALGLQFILKNHDIISNIYYRGEISHPQNKTIMNKRTTRIERTIVVMMSLYEKKEIGTTSLYLLASQNGKIRFFP